MFLHNFKYSLKILLKSRVLLFWTFAFPIILGILFNMAFKDIENNEKLEIINIAIVDNEVFKENIIFKESIKSISDEENKDRIFNTKYVSLEEAKKLLENEEITGYILLDKEDIHIKVNSSGINETVLRYVVDEIKCNEQIIQDLAKKEIEKELENYYINGERTIVNYNRIYKDIATLVNNSEVKLNNISNKNLSYTMIEYYTLIAMSCLYGGTLSMFITNYKLANMKSEGKRTAVSPIKKGKMILGSLLASYIIQLLGVAILFIFTIFILKVDFGTNLANIVLLASVGSLAGLSIRSSNCNINKSK